MHRRMIIWIALVLLPTIVVGVEAIWQPDLDHARIRILMLMCIDIGVVISALVLYRRHIADPLRAVKDAAVEMAEGRLNRSISVRNSGDIGRLGSAVNDLAANQQEILLVVWNHCKKASSELDRLDGHVYGTRPDTAIDRAALESGLGRMRGHLQEMRALVAAFDYFEVQLEGERMLTMTVPAEPPLTN